MLSLINILRQNKSRRSPTVYDKGNYVTTTLQTPQWGRRTVKEASGLVLLGEMQHYQGLHAVFCNGWQNWKLHFWESDGAGFLYCVPSALGK